MAYTIPYKVYEKLEEKLGKETASVVVEALEQSIRENIEDAKTRQKLEITEELKKELASKYDIKMLEQKMDSIEERLNYKLKVNTLLLIIAIILSQLLLNRENFEFLVKLLGIVR